MLGPGFEATDKPAAIVDVIDIATHKVIKSVPVHNTVHNIFITPDDSEVIAGLRGEVEPGEPAFQIIDPKTDTVAWGMELTGHTQYGKTHHEVRPMAFEADADGSTKRAYAQATGINKVFVIDWKARKVVEVLSPPKLPLWKQNADGIQTGDMHGLEVLPDRSSVWASSRLDSRIYGWSLPDLKYIGAVEVGPSANWMTSTPDSKYMYVAISGVDHTIAVDLKTLRHRREDQDRRAAGAHQHGDPAARSRQSDDDGGRAAGRRTYGQSTSVDHRVRAVGRGPGGAQPRHRRLPSRPGFPSCRRHRVVP